jgi:hypothetical protein
MKPLKLVILVFALPFLLSATLYQVNISVVQDGQDLLFFQGNTLQWQHINEFANGPATINAWVDLVQVVTNANWANGATGQPCGGTFGPCPFMEPNTYTLPFSLVPNPVNLTLTVEPPALPSGGSLTIFQLPTLGNNWLFKVDFNDQPPGGTHTYHALISFEGPAIVPEPASMALVGCGLVILVGLIARKRQTR